MAVPEDKAELLGRVVTKLEAKTGDNTVITMAWGKLYEELSNILCMAEGYRLLLGAVSRRAGRMPLAEPRMSREDQPFRKTFVTMQPWSKWFSPIWDDYAGMSPA